MSPTITQHVAATDAMVDAVRAAYADAIEGRSDIDPALLEIRGMSGRSYRRLINNLIRQLPDARYLEVGSHAGSTMCSAVNGNRVRATGIDNFSWQGADPYWEKAGGSKKLFGENLARFRGPDADVSFIEKDFNEVAFDAIGKFNVYLFDGPHDEESQYTGIVKGLPALDDEFVLIVDDWNWPGPRNGTLRAIDDLKLSVLFSLDIRTAAPGERNATGPTGHRSEWHNGYFIGVLHRQ